MLVWTNQIMADTSEICVAVFSWNKEDNKPKLLTIDRNREYTWKKLYEGTNRDYRFVILNKHVAQRGNQLPYVAHELIIHYIIKNSCEIIEISIDWEVSCDENDFIIPDTSFKPILNFY